MNYENRDQSYQRSSYRASNYSSYAIGIVSGCLGYFRPSIIYLAWFRTLQFIYGVI